MTWRGCLLVVTMYVFLTATANGEQRGAQEDIVPYDGHSTTTQQTFSLCIRSHGTEKSRTLRFDPGFSLPTSLPSMAQAQVLSAESGGAGSTPTVPP